MVEVSTSTPIHFVEELARALPDPRFERISDDSQNPLMDALNSQTYSMNREKLVERAHAIAKLYGKRSTASQTIVMTFMHEKSTQKVQNKDNSTKTKSEKTVQTYLAF